MLEGLYGLTLRKTEFLYTVLLQTPYFFFDVWSVVHLLVGGILMRVLLARRVARPFAVLLLLLVGYELAELALTWLAIGVFRPEILPDQVTDVWVGLLGGLAELALRRAAGRVRAAAVLRDAAVSVSVSAAWVAFYGYRYNVEFFNSRGINWWAFLWWSGGLFTLLRLFERLRRALSPRWLAIPATWAAWIAVLLVLEYIGYAVLGIREVHGGRPLVFDVVHGTTALRLYYPVAGLFTIGIAAGVQRLAARLAPVPDA